MSPMAKPDNGYENSNLEPIAICGMACRLPGGIDSDSSFWRMLVEKRSGQTSKVPKSRFNIDAHYHESLERPGSFNVAGGYFLDGRPEDFDPTFFNMTPIEAQWLDPQQRKILEVSYESLVSAGVTLESIAGSNTAVFIGSFTSDYQQMSIRDPDFRHNYAATGVDPGIISNRIGNTFNLKGPSFTINTACSSSIYALHYACQALRSRDCDAAIVGGVNLIITVDQHMNTAKLGILSPTSTCHTFDASADGYGRAEGAGALYVKRLVDAIRDGDPIRGVIRSTAVNTNGKVDGMGITHPSVEGQERVVRIAYEKAKLDPKLTAYAELHGTGTPVGDPIEVRAISRAMNDTRPKDKPLLVGAVKPNIGHSEAASGIFAVMKASMMTEAALIPGVAFFNKLNPNILEKEWNVKVHANTTPWPKDSVVRRASISSFGYGGTNGHVIIESIDSLYPWYQHAKAKKEVLYDRSSKKPFLLCFSAHDKITLSRNVKAVGDVARDYYLTDLGHTLNLHRTMFSHRAFTVAYEGREAEAFSPNALQIGVASKKTPSIGFLFTGQGAQWAGMGRVALQEFPIVLETIQKLDLILNRIHPKPSFKIAELLLGDDKSTTSRFNEAEVTQPLCTAIQIALVDLFFQWDIVPEVSIGHSSGEIGAAYAAGLVSAPEAIMVAFCRGRAVAENSTSGSMLAVGLGAEEIQEILPSAAEDICIACENSPSSVTLSGTTKSISELQDILNSKGVFTRELKTGRAYHSPHMAPVGAAYDILLLEALDKLTEDDLLWRQPRSQMISSVTGESIAGDYLPPGYWSTNLRQRVLFSTAVQRLGSDSSFSHVDLVIEVGPHSALSGPFKQICMVHKLDRFTYVPSLVRQKNDAVQLLSVAGSLFLAGYPVDMGEINSTDPSDSGIRKPRTQYLLVDLPPYQWNYEKQYWAEPRSSAEQRARVYSRHDLLGSLVSGLTTHAQVWRNVLRHRDIPWLKDHNFELGGTAIFPAAGYLSLAIEALRQVYETEGRSFEGVTLRDVDIKTALVIPDNNDGVETILRLQKPTDGSGWHFFAVESLADGAWTVHCEGRVSASHKPVISKETPVAESALTQRVSGKRWYNAFDRVGFYYGKTFQQLQFARTDRSVHHATGDVTVVESSSVMQGESRYLIHPSTVDACLQLIIISIHAGKHKEMPWGVVPTHIEELSIFPVELNPSSTGHAVAWTDGHNEREFNTNVRLTSSDGRLLLDIKNLTCITYDAALPAGKLEGGAGSEPFSIASWKPDIKTLRSDVFERLWPSISSGAERLGKLVELICHRQPVGTVLVCGSPAPETVEAVLNVLPSSTSITLGFDGEQEIHLSEEVKARVTIKTLPPSPEDWVQASNGPHDLALVDYSGHRTLSDAPMALVKDGGWLLGFSKEFFPIPRGSLQLGQQFSLFKTEIYTNGTSPHTDKLTVLSLPGAESSQNLREILSASSSENTVLEKPIMNFSSNEDLHVVIDDTTGTLFSSISSDAGLFEAVKTVLTSGVRTLWLTRGVKQGRLASAGMAEGLLRVIRSEQAAARIVLLDIDSDEMFQDVGKAIISKLETANTKDSGYDTEFWLHRGVLHISRVYPNEKLNQKEARAQEKPLPEGLPLKARTIDGQLVFEPDPQRAAMSDNEVEVQVLASELQLPTPGSRLLVCGTIIRAGSLIDRSLVGRHVVTFVYDGLQTVVRTSTYAVVDENEPTSPEALLQTLSPLCSLVNLCLVSTKLAQGDCVLLLPGPKPIVSMMARLAKAAGWKLGIVVNSQKEREQYVSQVSFDPEQVLLSGNIETVLAFIHEKLKESYSGIVTIIAHDFSPLSKEVWRCIPPFCRLLLSGATVEVAPDPLPFTRGATFISISLKALRASPSSAAGLLKQSLQVLKTYPNLLSSSSYGSIKVVNVSDANDYLRHPERESEASIVRLGYGESQVKILPEITQLRFSPDAIYLLVGCLGGLGRSLTRWMSERGAKHFAFISRSGADKPEATRLVESLHRSGASTQVFRADASDEEAVRRIVLKLNAEGPVRGAVHAATVLKDGIFEQMDYLSFADCVNPKAQGALSLHNALQGLDLDFFVMTSSISALLGNTGQSNYSAANSVLDALALQRSVNHLAGTSLVLPMVLDVGLVAENEAIEISLARKGLYGIDEREMLRGFEVAMSRPICRGVDRVTESQIIMGMEARELARSMSSIENVDAYWYNDARFCHVRAVIIGSEGQPGGSDSNSFAATIKDALAEGADAIVGVIAKHIAKRMSNILMIPVNDFELDGRSLGSYGLDSMIGAEMRTWIFKEFGFDYPFQKLLAPTLTFKGLAGVVAEKMGLTTAAE
ncbi:MAG: hypothetical protein MMC33_006956 [Icmadophila ericetorum]|nr:hypothetical protein [Icmadophila ericetorum]